MRVSDVHRNSGGRLLVLVGVLGWQAAVGVACLARGRVGFESLQQPLVKWPVSIMLVVAWGVLVQAAPRGARREDFGQRLGWLLAFFHVTLSCGGWGWLFLTSPFDGYDVLAAFFSRGFGARVDVEAGSGFAGVPLWAVGEALPLLGYGVYLDQAFEQRGAEFGGGPRRTALWRASVAVLAVCALGGLLHFANGTRLLP